MVRHSGPAWVAAFGESSCQAFASSLLMPSLRAQSATDPLARLARSRLARSRGHGEPSSTPPTHPPTQHTHTHTHEAEPAERQHQLTQTASARARSSPACPHRHSCPRQTSPDQQNRTRRPGQTPPPPRQQQPGRRLHRQQGTRVSSRSPGRRVGKACGARARQGGAASCSQRKRTWLLARAHRPCGRRAGGGAIGADGSGGPAALLGRRRSLHTRSEGSHVSSVAP